MTKVYSFDVFDTLLLRPFADPQELWYILEEKEKAVGFAKDRKMADAKTYNLLKRRGGETTIEEAYDLIPKWKYLMPKELLLEKQLLRANNDTLALWNKLKQEGKRLIIISDMYLSSDFIKSVLEENGFSGWDGFYLSRDYNARKITGELFKIVLEEEGIAPKDLHHIGDNLQSDVLIPRSLGISVQHYPKVIERLYKQFPFAKHIDGQLAGILAIGLHQYKLDNHHTTYWNRLGYMMGGVLGYLYVNWIVKKAQELGKNHLMFVARDGYIWKKICNTLYPDIKTDYIYAPRLTSIAVLGATGSDPWAIKDRQRFIDKNLNDVDIDIIANEFKKYILNLKISDKSVIIDGCSSGFSAQRLVEACMEFDVYGFYLLAMAEKENISALYSTNLYGLPFQRFSEFLFGSPEAPIIGVKGDKPIYNKTPHKYELFKMSVSSELAEGSIACAKFLQKEKIDISARTWMKYIDTFMKYQTDVDKNYLENARDAFDVKQEIFKKVVYRPRRKIDITFIKNHSVPNGIRFYYYDNMLTIAIRRHGISFNHTDTKVKIDE